MVAAGDEINSADITSLEDLTIRRPNVRLSQVAVQSIPNNTGTPISFTTEDFDPYNFHDSVTNNSRITPTVPGWYRFYGTYFSATLASPTVFACYFQRNGASIPPGDRGNPGTSVSPSVACTAEIEMNGSSDYVQLIALHNNGGAVNTAVSAYIASTFECEFVRSSA